MPWIIGIDEAGYGPNLGPLVMTSVACRATSARSGANLWRTLRRAVRRGCDDEDERLLIDDSKIVYTPARGLGPLEHGVLATALQSLSGEQFLLKICLEKLCPESLAGLGDEPWYMGTTSLPSQVNWNDVAKDAGLFRETSQRTRIEWGPVRSVVICPRQFNGLLETWGSKGAVLGHGLKVLLGNVDYIQEDQDAVSFVIDKHGGRNTYAPMLQDAMGEGMVVAHKESNDCSCYSLLGLPREMRFSFQAKADASSFCVALASMVSKYLRELLMQEFNLFWSNHVPGIKPTAGYPGDSARFYDDIKPAAAKLNIPAAAIWRCR
jgi:ribonuclease HII